MNKYELYKVLGLNYGASTEELKNAYRALAKKYHPDITKDKRSGERFAEIVKAYKILTVSNRTKNLVDFPVRNVRRTASSQNARQKTDIFSLGRLIEEGKTVGMRAFAARSLGNSGKRTAYAYLRKALTDESELVVKTAVEAIGNLGIHQSAGELSAVYSRGSREVRQAVLNAIARIGSHESFKSVLLMALRDTDPHIQHVAKTLLRETKKAVPDD